MANYFLEWKAIQAAMGKVEGLGIAFLPAMLAIVISTIGVYLLQSLSIPVKYLKCLGRFNYPI